MSKWLMVVGLVAAIVVPGVVTYQSLARPGGGGGSGERTCAFYIVDKSPGCVIGSIWCDSINCDIYACPPVGYEETWNYSGTGCAWVVVRSLGCGCLDGSPEP
jgi:hypothetical protein